MLVEPFAGRFFLEIEAGRTGRVADHLGELRRRRRQEVELAGPGLQGGQLGQVGAARIEIAPHRADDPDVTAARQRRQRLDDAGPLLLVHPLGREQLLHLVDHQGEARDGELHQPLGRRGRLGGAGPRRRRDLGARNTHRL